MKMNLIFLFLACFFSSCASNLALRGDGSREMAIAVEEIRMELADLKHSLNSTQVELTILDEKIKNQDNTLYAVRNQASSKAPQINQLSIQISNIEKKLGLIEKIQEKTVADLRQLSTHASQTLSIFSQYKDKIQDLEKDISSQNRRFDEISKLKSTLSSISKMMKQNSAAIETPYTYKVQPGDTLKGIARQFNTTVEVLKKMNHLNSDRILVEQELKLANESP